MTTPRTQQSRASEAPGQPAETTYRDGTPNLRQGIELQLMLSPGVAEYAQGYSRGWADAEQYYAERSDALDAAWQTVARLTWEQQVATRVAEMEASAATFPARAQEYVRRNDERDAITRRNAHSARMAFTRAPEPDEARTA